MIYGLLIVIHIFVSLVLILVILLQAGKGGGLSETFGVSSTQTILGQSAPKFLEKATSICAIVFLLTCLTLAILSMHRSRSIVVPYPQQGQTQPADAPVFPAGDYSY